MAQARFRSFDPKRDEAALIDLLTGERWPHRMRPEVTLAQVREELAGGYYHGEDVITELIELDGEVVGLVRADGLEHPHQDPQLDFRLREAVRGRGIGTTALAHITKVIFDRHPRNLRIEGQTRADNIAMRKVFARGGYVQEAVYRQAWPAGGDGKRDGVGYAILRGDWESQTTTPVVWGDPE